MQHLSIEDGTEPGRAHESAREMSTATRAALAETLAAFIGRDAGSLIMSTKERALREAVFAGVFGPRSPRAAHVYASETTGGF
jgi:hypothetical protein